MAESEMSEDGDAQDALKDSLQELKASSGVSFLSDWLATGPNDEDRKIWWKVWKWKLATVVESKPVELISAAVVLGNSVMLGISADVDSKTLKDAEIGFVAFFAVEVAVKMLALHPFFWSEGWMIFDFIVVVSSVIEAVLEAVVGNLGTGLSVLRIVRTFRVLRLVGRLETLNRLIMAFMYAMTSVVWVMILVFIAFFMFGVLIRSTFSQSAELMNDPRGNENWGSLPKTIVTLFQIATADSWTDLGRHTSKKAGPWVWAIILPFIFFAALGLFNLLTAVFVDSLFEEKKRAEMRKKRQLQESKGALINLLKSLFTTFDKDSSATLEGREMKEVIAFLKQKDTIDLFDHAGLDTEQIIMSLRLADSNNDGVSSQSFMAALETLNDNTQKKDVWEIQLRCKTMEDQIRRNEVTIAKQNMLLERICDRLEILRPTEAEVLEGIFKNREEVAHLEHLQKASQQRQSQQSQQRQSQQTPSHEDSKKQPNSEDAATISVERAKVFV